MTYNTIRQDGMVIRTAWDEYHAGPVELLITIDHSAPSNGVGITERSIREIPPLHQMAPDIKGVTSLRVVGAWIEQNKPLPRQRPENPPLFYARVALFVAMASREGERGSCRILANCAGVRPHKAKEWIATSRRLGMLTPKSSNAGRAYGYLTDKARETLASQSQSTWKEAA